MTASELDRVVAPPCDDATATAVAAPGTASGAVETAVARPDRLHVLAADLEVGDTMIIGTLTYEVLNVQRNKTRTVIEARRHGGWLARLTVNPTMLIEVAR